MICLNNSWQYTPEWSEDFPSGKGKSVPVRIPHTVSDLPLHYADPLSYQKISGYRRILPITPDMKGKRIFVQFDGAAHIATVYCNGTEIGKHGSGYTAFRFELTDYILWGSDNLLSVKLDSTENPAVPPFGYVIDYLTYGGIYRDVWMDVRSSSYIQDVWVHTPTVHQAVVCLELEEANPEMEICIRILDSSRKEIATQLAPSGSKSVCINAEAAIPWNVHSGVLYTAVVELIHEGKVIDAVEKTFGFRTISIDENNIQINGKNIFLRGLNRHQCFPYIGYAASASLQREDARILDEELGVNTVRTSHYPQSQAFIDECDRRGILVITEIPGWQHVSSDEEWRHQCIMNVEEMVRQYRSHPSILLWGVRVNESQDDDSLYTETNKIAHELDPSRPTTGIRFIEKSSLLEDVYAYNDFSHNGTNPGAKPKKEVMSETGHPLIISEANGHMFPTKSFDSWSKRQEQALRHAEVLSCAFKDGTHAGVIQWCMFDYPTHKDFGSGDRICYHGVMDSFRNPKPAAYVYASQSDRRPVLEIGSSMDIGDYPVSQIGSVYAFTNAEAIDLYKNDAFVKRFVPKTDTGLSHPPVAIDDTIGDLLESEEGMNPRQASLIRDCLLAAGKYGMPNLPIRYKLKLLWIMLRYHMKFEDGYQLYGKYIGNWGDKATVWRFDAVNGDKVISSVTKSPAQHLHLEAVPSSTELLEGDSYDMASVRLRVRDENGNIASYAQLPVSFAVEGPIEIAGPSLSTLEGGMGGLYIRTTGLSGSASLTVSSSETAPITIQFIIRGNQ